MRHTNLHVTKSHRITYTSVLPSTGNRRRPQHCLAATGEEVLGRGDRGWLVCGGSCHQRPPTDPIVLCSPLAPGGDVPSAHSMPGLVVFTPPPLSRQEPPIAAPPRGGGFEKQSADCLSETSIPARPVALSTARRQGRGGAGAAVPGR